MKVTRQDILSPANAASLIGVTLTIFGSLNLHSLTGVLLLGLGRFIDIFDGKIARATHVSRFGAIVDATCDKIGIAVLVPAVWIAEIAPVWLLLYILIQNVLNVILSGIASARNLKPTASKWGKLSLFVQNISLGFYALGTTLDNNPLMIAGLVTGIVSLYWAVPATYGYYRLVSRRSNSSQESTSI